MQLVYKNINNNVRLYRIKNVYAIRNMQEKSRNRGGEKQMSKVSQKQMKQNVIQFTEKMNIKNCAKRENGITLIALVITVIVLLILAGITISALSGNNGILENAGKAKEETEIAEIKEQAEIVKQGVLTESLVDGTETTRDDIINAILDEMGGTVEGNLITTEDDKYEIMVKEYNTIEVVEKGQGYIDAEYKEPAPASDFEYKINEENNTVTITRYIGTDTVVNIPETIEEKPVIELGSFSFSSSNLQSVKIPNTVQTIGQTSFYGNQLTYINIPKSVTKINVGAFNNNKLNEEQAFIYKRTSTGEEDKTTIVSYGGNQTNITIPETVTNIEVSAFYNCPNLIKVVIGKNVTRLGMGAFAENYNLVDVEFKGDVPNFNYVVGDDTSEGEGGDTSEDGTGSTSGTVILTSGWIFTYNENLKIKVPKGKLQDYKTAKVIVNGEAYYDTLNTWFMVIGIADESWLDVFYE